MTASLTAFLEKRLSDFQRKVNQNQETKGAHMQVHVHEWVCHYSFDIKHFLTILKSMAYEKKGFLIVFDGLEIYECMLLISFSKLLTDTN